MRSLGRTAMEGEPPYLGKGGCPVGIPKPGRIGNPSPSEERPDGSHQG